MKAKYKAIRFLLFVVIMYASSTVKAQTDTLWHSSIEVQGIANQPGRLPFWFRSGQFGSIPLSGFSASAIGSVYKDYAPKSKVTWAGGLTIRGNLGNQAYFTILEAYVKAKASIFELSAGRTKQITGIVDTALSSGSFSVAGNALGIPQVNLAIPQYVNLPIANNLFAIKANFAMGYFGYQDLLPSYVYVKSARQYYNQSSFYLRLGRPNWKLKLSGGINHNVMFGSEKEVFGPHYTLSPVQAALYAITGKTYLAPEPQYNIFFGGKVGNHVGSVDFAAQYEFNNFNLMAYHQVIYDVGAIGHLSNLEDGLNGLSIINKQHSSSTINWTRFLVEFLYTKGQAGQLGTTSPSGDEDYYNDAEFTNGWSYRGANIGNPLLASRNYTRDNLVNDPSDYIIDNRVIAVNAGVMGAVNQTRITMKLTYSKNYGTYGTSIEGHSTGPRHFPPLYGLFNEVNQFSGYAEANRELRKGLTAGVAVAGDLGGLYYNSIGVIFKLKKTF